MRLRWEGVVVVERGLPAPHEHQVRVMSARTMPGAQRAIACRIPAKVASHLYQAEDNQYVVCYAKFFDGGYLELGERASDKEFLTHPEIHH